MHSNRQTVTFIISICFLCALILSLLAIALKKPQANARELYKSRQLLTAARILDYNGTFLIGDETATYQDGTLVPTDPARKASAEQILAYYKAHVTPKLVDDSGNIYTFEEKGVNLQDYLDKNEKHGYAHLPLKLVYVLPEAYIIPINGYGLWDAIYGYLALKPDGNTVIGATWYDQKETPGLGGEISTPEWLRQFQGKVIFHKNEDGTANLERAPLGITVSKQPHGDSEVAAIAGATITCTAVSEAYRQSLAPYRPFLLQLQKSDGKKP